MNQWKQIFTPTRLLGIYGARQVGKTTLLKDILTLDRIKSSRTLLDLLRLPAFPLGIAVSVNERAMNLGIDAKTVKRYLDLFEKAFVIVRRGGFSRNLRQERTNKAKYYFLDNDIRNAIIANFNGLDQRADHG